MAAHSDGKMAVPFEVAAYQLAVDCGKWPWELEDQPLDKVLQALALRSAMAEGQALAAKIQQNRAS